MTDDNLQTAVASTGTELDALVKTWESADEVDTGLGSDIENLGQRLLTLIEQTGQTTAPVYNALTTALDHYRSLDEHDTNASHDIFDQLGPAYALLRRHLDRP
ncbi:hypothetical protein [Streptomyces roseolus]|uniref:hypothetical protein n=1 Tax=Streptomyces roseolus TaxID=67358 RepID=UPI0037A739A7